ncbi:MAG: DUF481 domain-containing protein [Bacteroidetes bacterium]|nr:DUF481 domain-containing protein [Bacteroidota bacterium]
MNTKKTWIKSLQIILLLSAISLPCLAQQVVHVENKRMSFKNQGFSGTFDMSANFVQNINDIFQTANGAQVQYIKNNTSLLSVSSLNLTVFNESKIVNDGFQHLRYNYKMNKTVTAEAFLQGQYNEVIKIRSRFLAGIGPRFTIISKDSLRLFIGSLYMYEMEEETTDLKNRHHRTSTYVSFGFPLAKAITVDFIGYFQPDMMNVSDFRASVEAIVELKISKRMGFRLAHGFFHDSKPPAGIRRNFYNFRNGLKYEF